MITDDIQQYIPLVAQAAKRYRSTSFYEDLKSDAYEEIMSILKNGRLDKTRPDKHVNYIRTALTATLSRKYKKYKRTAPPLPTHMQVKVSRFVYYKAILQKTLQRRPTIKDMAAALGWSIAEVKQIEIMHHEL